MKSKTLKPIVSELRSSTLRIARAHFFYVLIFAIFVLMYDAWKLVTYDASLQRWTVSVAMMFISTAVWYAARNKVENDSYYKVILMVLVALDIFVAGFTVYVGRGMASRGVALFAIPIIISALISRPAIFAAAAFSLSTYWFAAIKYFNTFPSEGYRVELYADLSFYGASFFILAALLYILRTRHKFSD